MDPRTFTVKQCEPAYLKKSGASIENSTSTRRDFFNSVGKVGDLAVLNSVGGGTVGRGLRNLASISNSIRTGEGSLPSSIGNSIDSGANWVLEQTGIAPSTVNAVSALNPGVANQAYGQAQSIYQRVRQGNFTAKDIPGALQDLQNLERLGSRIFTPKRSDVQASLGEHCQASPYALDLIARAPKYKFMFIVQFIPDQGYEKLGSTDYAALDMAFAVKTTTRPNVRFVMEDVNYYNFRTKVPVKTEFEEMQMSFIDDTTNFATRFFNAYTRANIPITGVNQESATPDALETSGMDFVDRTLSPNEIADSIPANTYSGSTGLLEYDRRQVFKEVRIYHLYDNGNKVNIWRFYNPRLTTLSMDELDMSAGSEGCAMNMSFNYDTFVLEPDVELKSLETDLRDLQRGAVYPLRYNATSPVKMSPVAGILPSPVSLMSTPANTKGITTENNKVTTGGLSAASASEVTSAVPNLIKSLGL